MTEWITDRPPTEADADPDGDVLVQKRPAVFVAVPWQYVAAGAPWRRTALWCQVTPAAKPTPKALQPRRYVSISRMVDAHRHGSILDAVADDGTAWWCLSDVTPWKQHAPLPACEVPADA